MSINEIMMSLEIGIIYGIVVIGIYLTFRVIGFQDLTCDGSFVFGAVVSALLVKGGYNPAISLLMALLAGSLAGFITGIINTYLKISELLSGILVAFMFYSINLRIMNGVPNIALIDVDTIFTNITTLKILGILIFIICILISFIFFTDFGLALRAIGQNKRLARNGGVNVKAMIIIGFSLSNGLIALGGGIYSQYKGFVDVGQGLGTIISGLAALIIGEQLFTYRSIMFKLINCLLGSIIYRLFISFALHSDVIGLETQDLNLITGLMIISVMYISRRRIC
ncbi:MAG: hypothetical protein HRU35_03305 [Rickettsiaceae bacterium]|nr:hypothetical protein [Rickettsiaceae bacterium]